MSGWLMLQLLTMAFGFKGLLYYSFLWLLFFLKTFFPDITSQRPMLNFSSCKLLIVNKRAHIYSENHRLAWVGSDPKEHTVPNFTMGRDATNKTGS